MASSSAAAAAVPVTADASKHNTDCVYFLASPLTCKKGNDCEFRHSENARVNPRDCWFWFAGNCLNEHCPFRHPPLDGLTATSTPTTGGNTVGMTATTVKRLASYSSALTASPTSRTKAPCFYYSQGFCGKGMKCMFLHGSSFPFKKEATTYRKPQVSEQQHEGNGTSVVKLKFEDVKAPITVLREACPITNNTYRRPNLGTTNPTTPNKQSLPIVAGNQIHVTNRLNKFHNVKERTDKSSEFRNSVPQVSDERLQNILPSSEGIRKGHLSRGLVQNLDRSCDNSFIESSGMEENMEALLMRGVRELRAGDLRNQLEKRRRSDNTCSTLPSNVHMTDHQGSGLESGSHLSRIVSKDTGLTISKRVKQDKDEPFAGPKSLAQIKAEKAKARIDVSFESKVDCTDGQKHYNSDCAFVLDHVIEKKVQSQYEMHHKYQDGYPKECATIDIPSTVEQDEASVVNVKEIQSFIADDPSAKSSEEVGDLLHQSSGLDSSEHYRSHRNHVQVSNEKTEPSGLNGKETSSTLMGSGYNSVDETMKDGGAKLVDTECFSDDEDEFAMKLGGFLS